VGENNGNIICAANSYSPLFNLNSDGEVPSNVQALVATASTFVLSSTSAFLTRIEFTPSTSILVSGTQTTSSITPVTSISPSIASVFITARDGQTIYCPDCVTVSIPPAGTITITLTPTIKSTRASTLTTDYKIGIGIGIPLNIPELPLGGHHEKAELKWSAQASWKLIDNWLMAGNLPYELNADPDQEEGWKGVGPGGPNYWESRESTRDIKNVRMAILGRSWHMGSYELVIRSHADLTWDDGFIEYVGNEGRRFVGAGIFELFLKPPELVWLLLLRVQERCMT